MTGISSDDNEYVMGRNAAEYERLSVQARAWEEPTRLAISRTGLSNGMSALDVGCGTGAAMRLMAEKVGGNGRVIGIDLDAAITEQALERLRAEGPDIFSILNVDILNLKQLNHSPFDLVFARALLIHLPNPLAVLSRLWEWVRPGGTLLIMDLDMTVSRPIPSEAVADRATRLFREIFIASGKDIEIGCRMPSLFVQSGIGIPDSCSVFGLVQPAQGGGGMLRSVLASLRSAAIAHGVADAETMDDIDLALSKIQPGDGFGRWPDIVATLKRKPA